MKIFISWSGEKSRRIAEHFKNTLPCFNNRISELFFAPEDIRAGRLWFTEIQEFLKDCDIGIVILTENNLQSPWIHFETGAIAKKVNESRIFVMKCGFDKKTNPPLNLFQSTKPQDKKDFKRFISELNNLIENRRLTSEEVFDKFEANWPRFRNKYRSIIEQDSIKEKKETHLDKFKFSSWYFYFYDYYTNREFRPKLIRLILSIGDVRKLGSIILHNSEGSDNFIGSVKINRSSINCLVVKFRTQQFQQKDLEIRFHINPGELRTLYLGQYIETASGEKIITGSAVIQRINGRPKKKLIGSFSYNNDSIPLAIRQYLSNRNLNFAKASKNIYSIKALEVWLVKKKAEKPYHLYPIKEYDAFLCIPIRSYKEEKHYLNFREIVNDFMEKNRTKFSEFGLNKIYFPPIDLGIETWAELKPGNILLGEEIEKLKKSRCLIVIFPEIYPSSVLVEIGIALEINIPIFIFYKKGTKLPYLLSDTYPRKKLYVMDYEKLEDSLCHIEREIKILLLTQ